MLEKILVPIYLPKWIHEPLMTMKRALIRASPVPPNIAGERDVEWTFLSTEMPAGPGEAIDFGCENGYLSLLAAQKGHHVIAVDLQQQHFRWRHPAVEFRLGDLLKLDLPRNHFDLAINCSSVEHVGIAGRYDITVEQKEGDIEVMERLADILKPGGLLLMTTPCGRDAVLAPWCRVYGTQRLLRLLAPFEIMKESYWIKNADNCWVPSDRETALNFEPRYHAFNPHGCAYALGCFVLRKLQSMASAKKPLDY